MGTPWRYSLHIPFILVTQVVFIVLFGLFARYDPKVAMRNSQVKDSALQSSLEMRKSYAIFQDVHVMIFIGFGFLMTFLKKYGLSAVSLNMLCSVLAIQWSMLLHGFIYPHCEDPKVEWADCESSWGYLDIGLGTLLSADFATAAVLISFGAVIGTTNPLQLLVMTLIEIVLFNVNEYIGRDILHAVDAGDTIFVHMFGAYFGLAVSWVLYNKYAVTSEKAGSSYTSDLFSMIGTVFLWMFWPSFNAGAAAEGDAQMRAVINTYLSLCACVMASFAASAFVSPERKFTMEHIQNATLAGGVAVGASADMMMTPVGAVIIGTFAGALSTCGFNYITPFIAEKLKITDSCGVHNLHGMPAVLGGLLSILFAALASEDVYDKFNKGHNDSLLEIFPEMATHSPGWQAGMQAAAMGVTMAVAVFGGLATGLLMKVIGQASSLKAHSRITEPDQEGAVLPRPDGARHALEPDLLFDDNAYFHVL